LLTGSYEQLLTYDHPSDLALQKHPIETLKLAWILSVWYGGIMAEASPTAGFEATRHRGGAPKGFTKAKTDERRCGVARLLALNGAMTGREVAMAMAITESTANRDIRRIKAAWRAAMIEDMDAVIARDLAELGMVKSEAWGVYVESCEVGEVVRTIADTKDGKFETVTETNPKPSLHALKLVMGCIEKRRRILGLDKETGGGGSGKLVVFTVKIGDRVIVSEASTAEPEDILDAEVVELDSTGRALPSGTEG
jgi:hypothetical protein